jgi:hypothetical protein
MRCQHCQVELADPPQRMCDACGMATGAARPKPPATALDEVRCPECGLPATSRRCRGCGARVRWPEDATPPHGDE